MTSVHLRIGRAALIRRRSRQQVVTHGTFRNCVESIARPSGRRGRRPWPLGWAATDATAVSRELEEARSRLSGIHDGPSDVLTVLAVVDDVQYEYTSVQVLRGTEGKAIAKWGRDG